MMVLWVMMLLSFVALEFAHSMRTEVEVTKNFRDEVQAYYLARAGIEIGRYELAALATQQKPHYQNNAADWVFGLGEDGGVKATPSWRDEKLGDGQYRYKFEVASDKLPLNKLADPANRARSEEMIKKFLEKYCEIDSESEVSEICQSILDWVDNDHIAGGSAQSGGLPDIGAEDDWYKWHDKGYTCKDAPFDSEDELRLIRGLRAEKGDSEEEVKRKEKIVKKFKRYFKVNVDLANAGINPQPQTGFLQNISDSAIIQVAYDLGWEGNISPEKQKEDRETDPPPNKSFYLGYYQVVSTAVITGSPVQSTIKASFQVRDNSPTRTYWEPLYWNDNYIPEYSEEANQSEDPNQPG